MKVSNITEQADPRSVFVGVGRRAVALHGASGVAAAPAARLRSYHAGAQAEDLSLCGPGDAVALHGAAVTRVSAGKYLRAHTLGPERW